MSYDYRVYRAADTTAGSGTISSTGLNVLGSSTSFTTQLSAGAVIFAAGQVLAVSFITDNTHLTLQTAGAPDLSGASYTYNNLKLLSALAANVLAPKASFKQWQEKIDLGNGLARGVGRPSTVWQWGFITQAQYDALRLIITAASNRLYIRTRQTENSDSYYTYEAAGLWPDEIDRQTTRRVNFSLTFRDLVLL